jgi:hypothetical protein
MTEHALFAPLLEAIGMRKRVDIRPRVREPCRNFVLVATELPWQCSQLDGAVGLEQSSARPMHTCI